MKSLVLVFFITFLSACVSYPEAVRVAEGTNLVSYNNVVESSEHIEKLARWSGVIAEIENLQSKTKLDILYYPSYSDGRPRVDLEPIGRFRVYTNKFLDPAIYKQGQSITALGQVAPKEMAKIGEYEYEYPTLQNATLHLWQKRAPRSKVVIDYGWYGYPRYYWHGGARHIYIMGKDKPKPNHVRQDTDKRN